MWTALFLYTYVFLAVPQLDATVPFWAGSMIAVRSIDHKPTQHAAWIMFTGFMVCRLHSATRVICFVRLLVALRWLTVCI